MTGWTDLTGSTSSFFGGGWAADLGPYTGPTSDLAAPPFLPGGASEVDYIVGPPNPDGLVADFRDGTYPASDWFDSGRYISGGTENTFDGGPVGVAGLHFMVAWYGPSAPDMPPEALVPIGWAAGAALDIGHWSDWHDGPVTVTPATDVRNGTITSSVVVQNTDPSTDSAAALAAALVAARAGSTGLHYDYEPLDARLVAEKFALDVGLGWKMRVIADLSQEILTFLAPDAPALTPPSGLLDGLVEGVDYGPDPYTGQTVVYESGAPAFEGWADLPIKTVGGYSEAFASWGSSGGHYRVPEGLVAGEVTYRAVVSALLPEDTHGTGATHVADWQPYGVGVEVGHLTTTIPAATPFTDPGGSGEYIHEPVSPSSGGHVYSHMLTLSDLGAEPTVSLISQSNYQSSDVAQPFDDFAVVADGAPGWESNVEGHDDHEGKEIFIRFTSIWGLVGDSVLVDDTLIIPKARFQQPRVRYWIPAPQWHTVGGHWASQSADVPLRILTPLPAGGSRWVDVVDGPA